MKLLPHAFKWIGLAIFLIGFVLSFIDDGRYAFIEGRNEAMENGMDKIEFVRIMPKIVSQIADYATLVGLLIYILARSKREDEFAQKLRYESAFVVLVISIILILIKYIFNPEFELSPSTLLALQMIFYLIVRSIKKQVILAE